MGALEAVFTAKSHYSGIPAFDRGCDGKIPHQSEENALRRARRIKKINKKHYDAYRCCFCGCWHVGTRRRNHVPQEAN